MSSAPILFVGDSLSVGTVANLIGAAKDVEVPVPAVELPVGPGTQAPGGRRAVQVTPALARTWRRPEHGAVWLALGTNDIAGNAADAAQGWTAYEALARELASWGLPFSLGTIPPLRNRQPESAAWSKATRELAGELGARLVPIDETIELGELPDGVHPSAEGYRRFGRLWLRPAPPIVPAAAAATGGLAVALGLALLYFWTMKGGRK